MKPTFDKLRPLSWSAISSFEYDKEQWYSKYVLRQQQPTSREMEFGKKFADSCEARKPLAPVTLYPVVEQELKVTFNNVPLIGYMDTYDPATHCYREFKTGKKAWDQKRANEHGQLKMYSMMLYITHKVKPEDYTIHLEWVPTKETKDFQIKFVRPIKVHTFEVKLKMVDILKFAAKINAVYKEMEEYALNHK